MGLLLLLERLSPAERAVFVLRAAFGHSYRAIADIVGLSEVNCRQLQPNDQPGNRPVTDRPAR